MQQKRGPPSWFIPHQTLLCIELTFILVFYTYVLKIHTDKYDILVLRVGGSKQGRCKKLTQTRLLELTV